MCADPALHRRVMQHAPAASIQPMSRIGSSHDEIPLTAVRGGRARDTVDSFFEIEPKE
jgi:hypothetical protein